jgi:hypothetical protein
MGYDIQNKDIRNKEIGNLECPFLLAISPGQRNFKSLIFHIKIGFAYYQCHTNIPKKLWRVKFVLFFHTVVFFLELSSTSSNLFYCLKIFLCKILCLLIKVSVKRKKTVNKCTINIKCANKKWPTRHKLSVKVRIYNCYENK